MKIRETHKHLGLRPTVTPLEIQTIIGMQINSTGNITISRRIDASTG